MLYISLAIWLRKRHKKVCNQVVEHNALQKEHYHPSLQDAMESSTTSRSSGSISSMLLVCRNKVAISVHNTKAWSRLSLQTDSSCKHNSACTNKFERIVLPVSRWWSTQNIPCTVYIAHRPLIEFAFSSVQTAGRVGLAECSTNQKEASGWSLHIIAHHHCYTYHAQANRTCQAQALRSWLSNVRDSFMAFLVPVGKSSR